MTDETALMMPPKVAAAISDVMGKIRKLDKGEKNEHGNYHFAGIDAFLEMIRPLCAEAGLIILQDEEGFEVREGWLLLKFRFTLAHRDGEVWDHQPVRSILVSSKMGSQAFGAAQSYTHKMFMRSLFQVSTGEKGDDIDAHDTGELRGHIDGGYEQHTDAKGRSGTAYRSANDPNWNGPLNMTQLKAAVRELGHDVQACSDSDELLALLNMPASRAIMDQCAKDLPKWWHGDGQDFRGLSGIIEDRRAAITSAGADT